MADPERYEAVPREHLIFQALRDEYPKSLSAKALMNRAALAWRQEPVPSFVSLCISFSNLNRHLSGTRWQAVRTGGSPDDHYALVQSSVGG